MVFKNFFPSQMNMNHLEYTFQSLYKQHPELSLDLPHSLEYCREILEQTAAITGNSFPKELLNSTLDEKFFFRTTFDTELYRHLRYLPVYWHSHSFFEIICVVDGNCTNYILEEELPMHAGDICIIAPSTQHAVGAFSDGCIIINIILRVSTFEKAFFGILADNDVLSDFFMRTLYHSKTHPYLFFRTGNDKELMDYVLYAYQEFLGNHLYKERFLNNIVSAFFIILLRNHGSNVIVPEIDTQGKDENVIFILKYMQENYCTVSLKELSDFFNYSERHIQRIIKSGTGASFSENIQKLKMRQAIRLLANPDISLSVIAEELGYQDSGNFRHTFKKFYGVTPAEYRDMK